MHNIYLLYVCVQISCNIIVVRVTFAAPTLSVRTSYAYENGTARYYFINTVKHESGLIFFIFSFIFSVHYVVANMAMRRKRPKRITRDRILLYPVRLVGRNVM